MTCMRYDIPMYKIPLWRKRHINWGILFSEKIQISQNELPQCIVVCVCVCVCVCVIQIEDTSMWQRWHPLTNINLEKEEVTFVFRFPRK